MATRCNPRLKQKIDVLCEEMGIKPGKLHERINKAQSTLSQIFTGKRFPSPDVIVAVCDELDCQPGDIFYVEKKVENISQNEE